MPAFALRGVRFAGERFIPDFARGLAPGPAPDAGRGANGHGGAGDGAAAAGPGITGGRVASRYAGAMLLHAFAGRARAGEILAAAAGAGGNGPADVALL